jgi:geranylgeranyl transferase type-1 subunit beta
LAGLAKWPDTQPDSLHTYLGLSGLSLRPGADLLPVEPALNISQRASRHLATLHKTWQHHH